MIEHDDTLGNFVKKHFTKDNYIVITSDEWCIGETYEKDWIEYFDGSVEEFLNSDECKNLRDVELYQCRLKFDNCECTINVILDDNALPDEGEE